MLQMLFQFLDYGDIFYIELCYDGEIYLLMLVNGVENEDNLIVCVVWLLMKVVLESGCLFVGSGVDISIEKCFFMGGGLGGGLFNVVIVLVVFNYFW